MNPPPQIPAPRRRIWRWVLLGVGICLTPFVVLALVAASFLTLDRDAAFLRKQVMTATGAGWNTKVQVSLGRVAIGAVRSGLWFVHDKDVTDARLALAAVRHASVGVYERKSGAEDWSREQLFVETDRVMTKRGWSRVVGVEDREDTVLVYASQDIDFDQPVEICVAVVNGKELVVVSTSVDASELGELVARHTPEDLGRLPRLAKLKF